MAEFQEYQAGVCNIGPEEIKRRRTAGIVGTVATVVLFIVFLLLDAPRGWRFLIFLPAMMAAVGFLQARLHFCAAYGMKAVFNFGPLGKTTGVSDGGARILDRKKALQILLGSLLIGIFVSVLAYLV